MMFRLCIYVYVFMYQNIICIHFPFLKELRLPHRARSSHQQTEGRCVRLQRQAEDVATTTRLRSKGKLGHYAIITYS